MFKYIKDNLIYPEVESKNGIGGLVVVKFVVEKDGSITNTKILKALTENTNKEALRLVNSMPK
ncbi:MAG: TonB family protein [Bacteroidota bacterium]|nr:TonB family protein [Bacteroidota bacterium]